MSMPDQASQDPGDQETHKILVVDDDTRFLNLMHDVLLAQGYRVVKVANGASGVAQFQDERPDLVFLDLSMPDMNGLQVLEAMQEINPDVKVVVITAYGTVELAVAALQQGACDFVEKLDYSTNFQDTLFKKVRAVIEGVDEDDM